MSREPSVSDALERTYEAAQSLIVQRIDLLVAESRLLVWGGALLVPAVLVALIGWVYLMHGVIDGLSQRYARFTVELGVGLANLGIAGWFRESPIPFLAGALALGWWLGARGPSQRRRVR